MRFSIKINDGKINTTGSINYISDNKKPSSPEAYYESLNYSSASYESKNRSVEISNSKTIGNTRLDTIQANPFNYSTNVFTSIGDKTIDSANTDLINVNKTLFNLSKINLATDTEDQNMASLNMLAALGCTVTVGNANRNLLDERTIDYRVNNPNIKTKRSIPNKRISTNKSFFDVDDPFYSINSGSQITLSEKETKKATNTRNLVAKQSVQIASYLASSGLVKDYSTSDKRYKASPITKTTLTKGLK
jgi:hypothetical protein